MAAESSEAFRRGRVLDQTLHELGMDANTALTRKQLAEVLTSYSRKVLKRTVKPSDHDLDFVFAMCDEKAGNRNGRIDGGEIAAAGDVWHAYLDRVADTTLLLNSFDVDRSGTIDVLELHQMFKRLNQSQNAVPMDATNWIFDQASVAGHSAIAGMELARALVLWHAWSGKADPLGPADSLYAFVDKDWPGAATQQGACCTIC